MLCSSCATELTPEGICPRCSSVSAASPGALPETAPNAPACVPSGAGLGGSSGRSPITAPLDPVKPPKRPLKWWESALVLFTAFLLLALIVRVQLGLARHWDGTFDEADIPEMLGRLIGMFLVAALLTLIVHKIQSRKARPAFRVLTFAAIAFVLQAGGLHDQLESARRREQPKLETDVNHRIGDLLKEAAGTKASSGNQQWWEGAARDFFHDIFVMNQQYTAEAASLDSSAIKDLYSPESYRSKAHMEKVVEQLQASFAVDEKYASVDPLVKRFEERITAEKVSESEKQNLLKGIEGGLKEGLGPRTEVIRTEEAWMKSTIGLYQYLIAHAAEYSVRNGKLVFTSEATRQEFSTAQAEAVRLHQEFLKAKSALDSNGQNKLEKLGLKRSDLPAGTADGSKPN